MRFCCSPKTFWLTINRTCDMRCKWCYAQTTNYDINNDMSLENVEKAISIIQTYGVNKLILIGGEPTRYKKIIDVLDICSNNGVVPSIITNGLSLNNLMFLDDLISHGLKNYNVSVKGFSKQEYVDYTGVDCFDKIMMAIDNLINRKVNLTISYVITNDNVNGLSNMLIELESRGVKNFYLSFCNPYLTEHGITNHGLDLFVLIENFIEQCKILFQHKIHFNFHMTLPLCIWPKEFIMELIRHNCISTTCQLQNRSGLIFDTNLNIIPCNSLFKFPILEYGKDYHDFKTLDAELYSPRIEEQFKKLLSSPSNKCINCDDFSVCAGGCLLQWLSYNFSDLMKAKEDYYARKTN